MSSVARKTNGSDIGIVRSDGTTEWFYCSIFQQDIFDLLRLLMEYGKEEHGTKVPASRDDYWEKQKKEISSLLAELREQNGVSAEQAREEELKAAQTAFEKALILWMRGEGLYEGRDIKSWAKETLELGYPRAQHLLWLMEGKFLWHRYECGRLFEALYLRTKGDFEGAFQWFKNEVELALDVDGMLCYAWSLYQDSGTSKSIIKAEKLLTKTKQYRQDSVLWKEVNNLSSQYSGGYRVAMDIHKDILQEIEAARTASDNEDIDKAIKHYEKAYKWDPSPQLGYEYALILQYRDRIKSLVIMENAAKEGYLPAIKSLLDYYGPKGRNDNPAYFKIPEASR